jgi:N-acetylneuraminic acid mutarotase
MYPRELVVLDLLSINANEGYNPKSISGTQKAPMLTARHHITAIVNGKIYVFGGRQLDSSFSLLSLLTLMRCMTPQKNTWTEHEPMPSNRG